MKAKAGVCVNAKRAASAAWNEPIKDGQLKHARFVWVRRGSNNGQNGNGPSGYKVTPSRRLARSLADRPGVALAVKKRQQAMEKAREAQRNLEGTNETAS